MSVDYSNNMLIDEEERKNKKVEKRASLDEEDNNKAPSSTYQELVNSPSAASVIDHQDISRSSSRYEAKYREEIEKEQMVREKKARKGRGKKHIHY